MNWKDARGHLVPTALLAVATVLVGASCGGQDDGEAERAAPSAHAEPQYAAGVRLGADEIAIPPEAIGAPDAILNVTGTSASGALSLTKTASPMTYDHAGEVITYTLVAKNNGFAPLDDVQIDDLQLPPMSCNPPLGSTLAPGASMTCTGTRTMNQGDVDHGHVKNTGTATASCGELVLDSVTVTACQTPHLTLVKSAAGTCVSAGDVIHYTLVATNDGNVTLTSVTISDPKLPQLACQSATLAPGASITCTGDYTVTQADVTAGSVANTATAAGTPPAGANVNDADSVTVDCTPPVQPPSNPPDNPVVELTPPVSQPPVVRPSSPTAMIAPTESTCDDFNAGTAATLSEVQYAIRFGKVSQVNPGVFFYYNKFTTAWPGNISISFDQIRTDLGWPLLDPLHGQVILYDASCTKVPNQVVYFASGKWHIKANGAPAGTYITRIKYNPRTVLTTATSLHDVTYTYQTTLNGALLDASTASVLFTPKH